MTSDERAGERPEDEGVPDYADDTSTAYRERDRPRFRDSPYPVPGREPQALDEHGLTAREQRQGESLDERLAREEPDVGSAGAPPPEGGAAEESAVHTVGEDDLTGAGFSEDQPAEDIGRDETAEASGQNGSPEAPGRAAP